MSYATRADLEARFGTDELAELLPQDRNTLDGIFADVAAEIDSALAERFALPLPGGTTYPMLVGIACDLARARLFDDEAPERVLGRQSSARKRLGELATGTRRLVDTAGHLVPVRSHAQTSSAEPRFSRDQLRDA